MQLHADKTSGWLINAGAAWMSSESFDLGLERFAGSACSGVWFRPVTAVPYWPISFCLSFLPILSVLFCLFLSVCPFLSVSFYPLCSSFSLPILFSVTPLLCPDLMILF